MVQDDRGDRMQRLVAWSRQKAPPLHAFLTSEHGGVRFVRGLLRDVLFVLAVSLLLGGLLWGATGQSFPDAPVVVVESGSMMHCTNGIGWTGDRCQSDRYGRFGTIDPGDLIFVRDADRRSDITTFAEGGKERYGKAGDVIIFKPGGGEGTPIIHRAMFWLEIHGDGTYSVPDLGIHRVSTLNDPRLTGGAYRLGQNYHQALESRDAGPEDSGFITRGDNNNVADQGGSGHLTQYPVKPEWVLGKARGEVPWLGLVKLMVFDFIDGQLTDPYPQNSNYENAPSDVRRMMWGTIVVAVALPWGVEWVVQRVRGDKVDEAEDPTAEAQQEEPRDEEE